MKEIRENNLKDNSASEKECLFEDTKKAFEYFFKKYYEYDLALSDWQEVIPIIKEVIDYQFEMQRRLKEMTKGEQVDWRKAQDFVDHTYIAGWVGEVFERWLLKCFDIKNPKRYLENTPPEKIKEMLERNNH